MKEVSVVEKTYFLKNHQKKMHLVHIMLTYASFSVRIRQLLNLMVRIISPQLTLTN